MDVHDPDRRLAPLSPGGHAAAAHTETRGNDPSAAEALGPDQPFVPRPYPRRAPGASPLRGRRILVIDGEIERGRSVCAFLSARSAAALHHDGGPGLAGLLAGPDRFEVILVRAEEADDDDLDALRAVPGRPAVVLVGEQERAESLGLTGIPAEPSDGDVAIATARALESRSLADENRALRDQLDEKFSFGNVVTRDSKLRDVLRTLESVADTHATVLLLGETGTGKSMLARTLHQSSSRRAGPYVEVNCGALPAGLLESELFGHAKGSFTGAALDRAGRFEAADGWTIFLDEIDSAPLELQVKLLRVVQDRTFERVGETQTRTVDVRIVAATNGDLEKRVIAGEFREDLLWRLRVVEVELPPLRDRARDLAALAETFVARFADEYDKPLGGITAAALGVLAVVRWPGNVRQLEHAIERAVLLSSRAGPGSGAPRMLDVADLGEKLLEEAATAVPSAAASSFPLSLPMGLEWLTDITRVVPLKEALAGPEKLLIERALAHHDGRRDRAAQDLGINRSTLFNKMRKYGLLDVNFVDRGA